MPKSYQQLQKEQLLIYKLSMEILKDKVEEPIAADLQHLEDVQYFQDFLQIPLIFEANVENE